MKYGSSEDLGLGMLEGLGALGLRILGDLEVMQPWTV